MPNSFTKIKFKRSANNFILDSDGSISESDTFHNEPLLYGEPLFFGLNNSTEAKCKYLAIGNDLPSNSDRDTTEILNRATFFQGFTDKSLLGKSAFINTNNNVINENGELVNSARLSPESLIVSSDNKSDEYSIVMYNDTKNSSETGDSKKNIFVYSNLYVTGNGVLSGGAWNDYAERRNCLGKPGQIVCENGDGTLSLSKEKLQKLPCVISDTYGFVIGKNGKDYSPVAISGRALVYVNCEVEIGDVLCADKDGYATVMSRIEVVNYPDRILGIVSEIPTYESWNDINIDNRVWVTIK